MNILAMILAGGTGTRLHPLTAQDAKPALPFAVGIRIIDFVLSNLANSGVHSIYVLAQYKPRSLIEHIRTMWSPKTKGRDRFIRVVLPDPDVGSGIFKGTADAVYQNLRLIERHRPDLVAVFSADHVYRMDVRQMARFHLESAAEVSIAAVPVPIEKASAFGIITAGPEGELRDFQEKPECATPMPLDPGRAYASMGNYLFNPDTLIELLETANQLGGTDFGYHVLPRLLGTNRAFVYDFDTNRPPGVRSYEERSYWRDIGTVNAYHAAQRDVLGPAPRFALTNPDWPIHDGGYGDGRDMLGRAEPLLRTQG